VGSSTNQEVQKKEKEKARLAVRDQAVRARRGDPLFQELPKEELRSGKKRISGQKYLGSTVGGEHARRGQTKLRSKEKRVAKNCAREKKEGTLGKNRGQKLRRGKGWKTLGVQRGVKVNHLIGGGERGRGGSAIRIVRRPPGEGGLFKNESDTTGRAVERKEGLGAPCEALEGSTLKGS